MKIPTKDAKGRDNGYIITVWNELENTKGGMEVKIGDWLFLALIAALVMMAAILFYGIIIG